MVQVAWGVVGMALRLGRVPGQALLLRTDQGLIRIKLDGIDHGTARLAIEAPESINVVREELVTGDKRPQRRRRQDAPVAPGARDLD